MVYVCFVGKCNIIYNNNNKYINIFMIDVL